MTKYILPILLLLLLIYSVFKKANAYDSFIKGAKEGIALVIRLLPVIATVLIAVELLNVSGVSSILKFVLTPVFNLFKIPSEIFELIIIKPFSGSGSIAVLNNILQTYGADSYIGRCASVIASTSETVFYVSSVYISGTSVKKLGLAIPLALLITFVGIVLACLLLKIM